MSWDTTGVLVSAIQDLQRSGPGIAGVKSREEIGQGILTLHVARSGRKGRHFLMLRVGDGQEQTIEVVRTARCDGTCLATCPRSTHPESRQA